MWRAESLLEWCLGHSLCCWSISCVHFETSELSSSKWELPYSVFPLNNASATYHCGFFFLATSTLIDLANIDLSKQKHGPDWVISYTFTWHYLDLWKWNMQIMDVLCMGLHTRTYMCLSVCFIHHVLYTPTVFLHTPTVLLPPRTPSHP